MAQKRVGCYACFQTLDPKDKNPRLRAVIKCERCGALYHAPCREDLEACYRCGGQQFNSVRIARPASLGSVTKQHVQMIRPSTVVELGSSQGKQGERRQNSIKDIALYLFQAFWAILLALLLVVIAALIGSYTYRLIQLPVVSAKTVMDAIFRTALPNPFVVVSALTSGLIAGSVFYSRPRQTGRRSIYLLAGIILLLAFDFLLLNIYPPRLLLAAQAILTRYGEIFIAEGVTAIVLLLLIPLHRGLAPVKPLSPRDSPQWLKNLYGWLRLFIASFLLIVASVYFALHWLPNSLNQPPLAELDQNRLPTFISHLSVPTAGAIAMAIIIAAIFYWPPQFRQVQWRLGIVRLLIVMIGVVAIGLLYRSPINPQSFLATLEFTSIITFVAIPIQRALS